MERHERGIAERQAADRVQGHLDDLARVQGQVPTGPDHTGHERRAFVGLLTRRRAFTV